MDKEEVKKTAKKVKEEFKEINLKGIDNQVCSSCQAPILMQTGTCSICTFCGESQGGCS